MQFSSMNTLQINLEIPDVTNYTNIELVSKIRSYIESLLGSPIVVSEVRTRPNHQTKSDAELAQLLQDEICFDQRPFTELVSE